jgi:glycine/D-amino acid oxidase-like deaminating enzyme
MFANSSPWIAQLHHRYVSGKLQGNIHTDIAIVGAGIAGVSTAYFILKYTDKQVALIEGQTVASGATGHNAGQIVSHFETHLSQLVEEFGVEMTMKGQEAINTSWKLIEEIFRDAKLKTDCFDFIGFTGCQDVRELGMYLDNLYYQKQAGMEVDRLEVSETVAEWIPEKYTGLYSMVGAEEVMRKMETKDSRYIAVLSVRKGCMNSSGFCEELVEFMSREYGGRFTLCEHSRIEKIELEKSRAVLIGSGGRAEANRVVLCTNGFWHVNIVNEGRDDIEKKFRKMVRGIIGYMSAYIEETVRPTTAISYMPERKNAGNDPFEADPYFYITRRPYELEDGREGNLISVGGPETRLEKPEDLYLGTEVYPEEAMKALDAFLHEGYAWAPEKIAYSYHWHGLMGYTTNGMRAIGPEPLNPVLMYNLGCNGVGILPSIYGGRKIAEFLNGEVEERSMFDVGDTIE